MKKRPEERFIHGNYFIIEHNESDSDFNLENPKFLAPAGLETPKFTAKNNKAC